MSIITIRRISQPHLNINFHSLKVLDLKAIDSLRLFGGHQLKLLTLFC